MRRNVLLSAVCGLSILTGACATGRYDAGPPMPESPPPPASPFANLNPNELTWEGPLPPNMVPLNDTAVNAMGQLQFIPQDRAVAQFGEGQVRRGVVSSMHFCYRNAMQRWAMQQLRTRAAWVEEAQRQTRGSRRTGVGVNYALAGGSAAAGLAIPGAGWAYSALVLFGAAQSANNNRMWAQAMNQNDRMIALNMAMSAVWMNSMDIHIEAFGQWCDAFMNWTVRSGGHVASTNFNYGAGMPAPQRQPEGMDPTANASGNQAPRMVRRGHQ